MKNLGLVAVVGMTLGLVACADDEAQPEGGPIYLEAGVVDLASTCGPEVYPCGPYGTEKDNVAENMSFLGFWDPGALCKPHKDQKIDLNTMERISFQDWYLANEACAEKKKKLLWVNVAAGWCGPCQAEVTEVQKQMLASTFDERVGFLNIVFETENYDPATAAFIKTWATSLELNFPVVMDPAFDMGLYFNASATPFNMLVDTSTMKIIYRDVGADFQAIGEAMQAFLANL